MQRYITDELYNKIQHRRSVDIELAEKRLYKMLSAHIAENDYIQLEEKLNKLYSAREKEFFYYGFMEGIGFLFKCIQP